MGSGREITVGVVWRGEVGTAGAGSKSESDNSSEVISDQENIVTGGSSNSMTLGWALG